MFYLKVGFRNIIKNYRRSLITMISIIIGTTACLLTQGFFNWNLSQMKEAMIHSGVGHYQLYAAGFTRFGNDNPFQYLIKDAEPIIAELRDIPGVKLVTTRMAFNGILSSGDKSAVIVGEAGNPDNERILNTDSGLIGGVELNMDKPYGLIVGAGVGKKLSAKLGDTLTLIGNMKDGGINAVDLELVGITDSGSPELDNVSAVATLGTIQTLLNIDNNVQKIVVLLKDTQAMEQILPRIKEISKKYQLEYRSWDTLAEFYQSLKLMFEVVFYIIILILLVIVTFTISNTINMNINERVREIGTIRALGTGRTQVALIFIVESGLIGVIGGLIGLFISCLFIGFTELIGGLPVIIGGAAEPLRVFFHPDLRTIIICMALFSVMAMVAAIVPSRRASRISITDALRWI